MEHRFTEVIRVEDGVFCNIDLHLDRICRVSTHFFGTPTHIDFDKLTIPKEARQGVVKCRVVYGLQVYSITFDPYSIRSISKVALVEDDTIDYSYKYEDRSSLNLLFNLRGGCDDILIVKNGMITDTSFSNVVFKNSSGLLFTPSTPLLAGTKRAVLLSEKRIFERKVTVEDINLYSGFYIINAMINIEDNVFIESGNIIRKT